MEPLGMKGCRLKDFLTPMIRRQSLLSSNTATTFLIQKFYDQLVNNCWSWNTFKDFSQNPSHFTGVNPTSLINFIGILKQNHAVSRNSFACGWGKFYFTSPLFPESILIFVISFEGYNNFIILEFIYNKIVTVNLQLFSRFEIDKI